MALKAASSPALKLAHVAARAPDEGAHGDVLVGDERAQHMHGSDLLVVRAKGVVLRLDDGVAHKRREFLELHDVLSCCPRGPCPADWLCP